MSILPPAAVASVLASPAAQKHHTQSADADQNRAAEASRELATIDQRHNDAVENTDADSRVHPDAGGQGGFGRSLDEHPDGHAAPPPPPDEAPVPPPNHLDLTA